MEDNLVTERVEDGLLQVDHVDDVVDGRFDEGDSRLADLLCRRLCNVVNLLQLGVEKVVDGLGHCLPVRPHCEDAEIVRLVGQH